MEYKSPIALELTTTTYDNIAKTIIRAIKKTNTLEMLVINNTAIIKARNNITEMSIPNDIYKHIQKTYCPQIMVGLHNFKCLIQTVIICKFAQRH